MIALPPSGKKNFGGSPFTTNHDPCLNFEILVILTPQRNPCYTVSHSKRKDPLASMTIEARQLVLPYESEALLATNDGGRGFYRNNYWFRCAVTTPTAFCEQVKSASCCSETKRSDLIGRPVFSFSLSLSHSYLLHRHRHHQSGQSIQQQYRSIHSNNDIHPIQQQQHHRH